MEAKSEESSPAEDSPAPSVAKLAGIFGNQLNSPKKEIPPHKPTRRKPPCSLPLHTNKADGAQNAEEKVSPSAPQLPKIKVKSSPLIEKLQANLAFAPTPFLPGGGSPKSPGLKVMTSPFNSPPSTPSSPGMQSRSSETEEIPVSFEEPPEGAHLQSYTKVRTRGSIKRRPPSRRFRKSQSDTGGEDDSGASTTTTKLNGDNRKGDEDDVFDDKSKSPVPEDEKEQGGPTDKSPETTKDHPEESVKETNDEDTADDKEKEQDSDKALEIVEGTEEATTTETETHQAPEQDGVPVTADHVNGKEDESPESEAGHEESPSACEVRKKT
uniref:RCSD domain containing 1 n=1 Tax=Leptobrachium leishanense TaxID=445787 RepID=A0A8C5LI29_9ANUR